MDGEVVVVALRYMMLREEAKNENYGVTAVAPVEESAQDVSYMTG